MIGRVDRPQLSAGSALARPVVALLVATLFGAGVALGQSGRAPAGPATVAATVGETVAQDGKPPHLAPWPREQDNPTTVKPNNASALWLAFIGEYGSDAKPIYIFDRDRSLWLLIDRGVACRLEADARDARRFTAGGACAKQRVVFAQHAGGRTSSITIAAAVYPRRQVGPAEGSGQLRVDPLRPVADLLKEARALVPPAESGSFEPSDLVEVVPVVPTIKLDVRYATTNNFLGAVFYSQPRAFLQRPAVEALARVQRALQPLGYGLLVHDGYRPWYVTKVFWDATPEKLKWLVANPSSGSRHNRGAAVDLTLYELASGRVVQMPSTYDESTARAYAFYPGGTDLQRWHRALLRRLMEAEGFAVNPEEWWHFDYKDWRGYRIGNVPFEQIK